MKRLFLARHGLTTWNSANRYQGQQDIPLSETGLRQAQALGRRLRSEVIDIIYTSDLSRAWQTAQAVLAFHPHLAALPDPRLRELCFGAWEGLAHSEVEQRYPQELAAWIVDPFNQPAPGGESLRQLTERVQAVLDELQTEPAENVLIVAHGGSLQVMICLVLELPVKHYWQFRLDNASLTEFAFYPAGSILKLFNDTTFLESGTWGN
jgi:alpha-ribazole phosphatase